MTPIPGDVFIRLLKPQLRVCCLPFPNIPVQFWPIVYLRGELSDNVLFQPLLPLISSEAATDTRFFEPLVK